MVVMPSVSDQHSIAPASSREMEAELLRDASSLILRELESAGVSLRSLASRIESEQDLLVIAPVFMRHLYLNYPEPIRLAMVRSLSATKIVAQYRDEFLKLFKESGAASIHFRFALAHAVACSTNAKNLGETIGLLYEKQYGEARVGLLSVLKKYIKRPEVMRALEDLRTDPDLIREINSWKKI